MSHEYQINYKTTKFKNFVISLLKRCKISEQNISKILSLNNNGKTGLELYSIGFTHKSINELYNYEYYEWMGDSTANNCVCWYLTTRFPQLKQPKAVKILARLKINLGSKKTFYQLSEKLGFWDFISASEEKVKKNGEYVTIIVKQVKKKDLLEDTLEAFIGITQTLIDSHINPGDGFRYCYNFIKSLYDEINISLAYKDLYDAKTRLKEMFDEWTTEDAAIKFFKEGYGSSKNIPDNLNDRPEDRVLGNKKWSKNNIKAEYISEDECGRELEFGFWKVQVVFKGVSDITVRNNSLRVRDIVIGRGQAPKKDQAEQLACEDAINYLNKDTENVILTKLGGIRKEHKYTIKGIYKTIDPIYEEINKLPNREVEEVKDVVNFEKMKRHQLIDYCKKHKIKGYSNKKKKDIIELINNKI
tara:strand:- start:876 stop:2123 length:1248 start_codon:yes stop_codon:yes gene_type:complete